MKNRPETDNTADYRVNNNYPALQRFSGKLSGCLQAIFHYENYSKHQLKLIKMTNMFV